MKSRNINSLVVTLLSIRDRKSMIEFLDGILTPKEREEIPVRLEIVKLLKKGVPQHEIAERLGVGVATVTRGSKEIAKGNFNNWR